MSFDFLAVSRPPVVIYLMIDIDYIKKTVLPKINIDGLYRNIEYSSN